jgi:hypothetical protein
MSVSFGCKCDVKDRKNWVVFRRHYNNSYFQYPKGQPHYSDYSTVYCLKCRALGRTKADYVVELRDATKIERGY